MDVANTPQQGAIKKPTGAKSEIIVDGVPRSYRLDRETAIGSAQYLKSKHPAIDVARDLTTGEVTMVKHPNQK